MAETHRRDKRWFNYPPKRELRVPYTEPKAEGNPVLRGQVLQLAATVLVPSPVIDSHNLKLTALNKVSPRSSFYSNCYGTMRASLYCEISRS